LTPVEAHSGRWGSAPAVGEQVPALGAELLLEHLVRQARVGQACLALEGFGLLGAYGFESLVDLGVHAGDEERGDRVDLGEVVAVGLGLLEASHELAHNRQLTQGLPEPRADMGTR
jgi:hypothetical protein